VGAWWRDGMVWRWEILVGAWRRDAVPAAWRRCLRMELSSWGRPILLWNLDGSRVCAQGAGDTG
jgi:hypothetical protein